jgi:hypothetical protein
MLLYDPVDEELTWILMIRCHFGVRCICCTLYGLYSL